MKAIALILSSLTLITSASAFAEFEKHEPAQIDFNRMIEENNAENSARQNELADENFGTRPTAVKSSKKRVTDLIDAELGWGEAPQIVDRRYNSVSEPVVVRLIPVADSDLN